MNRPRLIRNSVVVSGLSPSPVVELCKQAATSVILHRMLKAERCRGLFATQTLEAQLNQSRQECRAFSSIVQGMDLEIQRLNAKNAELEEALVTQKRSAQRAQQRAAKRRREEAALLQEVTEAEEEAEYRNLRRRAEPSSPPMPPATPTQAGSTSDDQQQLQDKENRPPLQGPADVNNAIALTH